MKGFLQRILQDFMKKTILGTSDAWSTSHLSHRPSKTVYYIVDWWIFKGLRFDPARHDTLGRSVNSLAKSNLMQLIGETFWLISHCDPSWDEVSWTSTHEISIRWLHQAALRYTITTLRYILTRSLTVRIHTTEDLEFPKSWWRTVCWECCPKIQNV